MSENKVWLIIKSMGLLMSTMLIVQVALANEFDMTMKSILNDYLLIQDRLSSDEMKGIHEMALKIHEKANKISLQMAPESLRMHYKNVPSQLKESSLKLSKATSIEKMREAFQGLSQPMANWTERHHPDGVGVYFCSMAKASWIQKGSDVRNPYYGQQMLGCGERMGSHGSPHHGP